MLAVALVGALAIPGTALAGNTYPPAGNPGKGKKQRSGKAKTLKVCKRGCAYKRISAAVKKARGGDTIRVKNGTYREGVTISGSRYDGLKVIGNARAPRKVKLDARRLKGAAAQNGFFVNGADNVTIRGFYARNYRANGFFIVNVNGYRLANLISEKAGVYGIYAFNSKGGTMSNSTAFHSNDAGFYIGQTPKQTKPKRSVVKNVKAYENVLGFSGTNMKYVTIKNSDFFNNGAGIVPNALSSEKFPPPEENVVTGNRVFWNNFNYYRGAPFRIPDSGPAGLPGYPLGVGILLFGSQKTVVEKNQVFGNWLTGIGAIQQVILAGEKDPKLQEASVLRKNTVRNNKLGLGGRDLNGRDLFYDGSGTQNCFANNQTFSQNLPADNNTFVSCPGPAKNNTDSSARGEALNWVVTANKDDPSSFEKYWLRHTHSKQKGLKPVVRYKGKKG